MSTEYTGPIPKIGSDVDRVGLLAMPLHPLPVICRRGGSVFSLGHPATKAFSRSPRNYQSLGAGSIDEPPAVTGVA